MDSNLPYVKTAHETFLALRDGSTLVQLPLATAEPSSLIQIEITGDNKIASPAILEGCSVVRNDDTISIIKDGFFLCAEPGIDGVVANRSNADAWEIFYLVQNLESNEEQRFYRKVMELQAQNKPVCLHFACGRKPLKGFLNIDRTRHLVDMGLPEDEFFVFPFLDKPLNIPDASVDYVYHEDFIEHVYQYQQIQFLAEVLRVLKPGCYHRINTPDLIDSMKRHSDFTQGFKGVYTGELQWGHIALFTLSSLKEMAELVGYRNAVFTTKSQGVSPYAVPDTRPDSDRDEITGNLYADLLKAPAV